MTRLPNADKTPAMATSLPDPDKSPTMTIPEGAAVLGISTESAYQAARNGEIPTIRIGRRVLILTAPFTKLLGRDR